MAILNVSDELIKQQPEILELLKAYFDSMYEMVREYPRSKRFLVQKEGIPKDGTVIDVIMKRSCDGFIEIINVT